MTIILIPVIIGLIVSSVFFGFLENREEKLKRTGKMAFVLIFVSASAFQYPIAYKVVIIRPDQRPTVQINKTVSINELDSISKANFYGAIDIVWMLKYTKNIYIKINSLEFSVDTREVKGIKNNGELKLKKLK